ncbi:hypothetical protein JRI60_42715 [Archangium violaceum]|uniref:hypothetical protein n=1 Tax=Archangium violaceum TaxID=83451 RepID=UPI001950E9C9|nr:hypothetical protein [Archangium violaceum]QRO03075.1 hypothetical protein JRI60_42715 [Archangium violaceum]
MRSPNPPTVAPMVVTETTALELDWLLLELSELVFELSAELWEEASEDFEEPPLVWPEVLLLSDWLELD